VDLLAGQPVWLQAVGIIVVLDFLAYWMHRGKHRFHWWWRLHETHHSSVDLDWFSSVRFHPLEKILDRVLYLLPLMVLGASEEPLLILAAVDALVASFAHANLNLRYGPLNYVIVGPEMHRWHHSTDPDRQNRNFGNNLSIFDWIFGTAYLGREQPTEYGLVDDDFAHGNFLKQIAYPFRQASSS
jgi:sterol desaturase/sphingolipid hydroxylase (fatty acid hydroxylase superfamily)